MEFKHAQQFLGEEYLTSLGFSAKDLSPSAIYEAVNNVYKSNSKSIQYLGKGIDHRFDELKKAVSINVGELKTQFTSEFPNVGNVLEANAKYIKKIGRVENDMALLNDSH